MQSFSETHGLLYTSHTRPANPIVNTSKVRHLVAFSGSLTFMPVTMLMYGVIIHRLKTPELLNGLFVTETLRSLQSFIHPDI